MTVTHLDDVFLGGKEDSWQSYLDSDEIGDAGRGWCIERTLYEGELADHRLDCRSSSELSSPPCTKEQEISFVRTIASSTSGLQARCFSPHPMLDVPSGRCPCPSGRWVCVRPAPEEHILRIQLGSKSRNSEHVVLWSGDRRGVLEDVEVGTQMPRIAGGVTRWATMFLE